MHRWLKLVKLHREEHIRIMNKAITQLSVFLYFVLSHKQNEQTITQLSVFLCFVKRTMVNVELFLIVLVVLIVHTVFLHNLNIL